MKKSLLVCALIGTSLAVCAQQPKTLTAADYTAAERWMPYNVAPLVTHTVRGVEYLPDGRIFYRERAGAATLYFVADPHTGTKGLAFDSAKLASELKRLTNRDLNAGNLGISGYKVEGTEFSFDTSVGRFRCNQALVCRQVAEPRPIAAPKPAAAPKPSVQNAAGSPATAKPGQANTRTTAPAQQPAGQSTAQRSAKSTDEALLNRAPVGGRAVFTRDANLWLRDLRTGAERPLTTDGVDGYGYATDNAGWEHSNSAIATWSADGKMLATFQLDERNVGMMYVVPVTNRHPQLEAWHYPLLGDAVVATIAPVIIDVETGTITRLKTAPLEHRSMECDDVSCGGGAWTDAVFSADDAHLAFVATSRDHKDEYVRVADTTTGDVREVYHEHVPTYYGWQSATDWKYMPASNEFLWVSERSNTAEVYLYDLATGKLKRQLTHGDGPVSDIVGVDQAKRMLYFTALGRVPGEDPYFEHLYSVSLDGGEQHALTPEDATHTITAAPDAATFVDSYSTMTEPATTVVRAADGHVLMTLAKEDDSALLAAGWKPPMPVKVMARDGKTPLYGYVWRPTNFDATRKYPVIDEIYPGPQGSVCQLMGRNFAASKGDMQAIADLGFVTVCIDGMGNPGRTKSFHDAHASTPADMGDDTIPDQVSGIRDLAAQFAWIDATRVGIWGHSGGGNATVSAMFHFPQFFQVGWAESGNHDNRAYEDDWDERWAGLEVISDDGKVDNYASHANQLYAANLRGKLMLVHGSADDNVPENNTLLLVQALMKAGKDFDMLIVPDAHHGYGAMTPYIERRKWDYFVTHLLGATPPAGWQMVPSDKEREAYRF